jgi:ribonuclease HI
LIVVFCDGAAKGNPGPGGWGAVVVTAEGHVTELGGRSLHTTNNRMELTAAIEGLRHVEASHEPVAVYTDSTYVIRGISEWVHAWKRRGWKTVEGAPVLNQDLWQDLDRLASARGREALGWHYVAGHSGIAGNERVDAIADGLARGTSVQLFEGSLAAYDVPILDLPDDTSLPARPRGGARATKRPAHSYLSLVNGQLARHSTWAECEARVKGRAGARFKKAATPDEEAAILRAWGLDRE